MANNLLSSYRVKSDVKQNLHALSTSFNGAKRLASLSIKPKKVSGLHSKTVQYEHHTDNQIQSPTGIKFKTKTKKSASHKSKNKNLPRFETFSKVDVPVGVPFSALSKIPKLHPSFEKNFKEETKKEKRKEKEKEKKHKDKDKQKTKEKVKVKERKKENVEISSFAEPQTVVRYTFGSGILPTLFGPLCWFFIHIFSFINTGSFEEQKEFVRLICICLPCFSCYRSFKKFISQSESPFSIERAQKMFEKTQDRNAYGQVWWHEAHNYVNHKTGKKRRKPSILKHIRIDSRKVRHAIQALIFFLQRCATYQMSSMTRFSQGNNDETNPSIPFNLTDNDKDTSQTSFRQLLPLIQLITFIMKSNFLRKSKFKSVQKFLNLCEEARLLNSSYYKDLTDSSKLVKKLNDIHKSLIEKHHSSKHSASPLFLLPIENIQYINEMSKERKTYKV